MEKVQLKADKDSGTFIDGEVFDDSQSSYTSGYADIRSFREFLLRINLTVTLAPTNITIDVEISDDATNWYKYMQGPFGSLMYEDTAGNKMECLPGKCADNFIRLKATATGTDATNKFTLTAEISFVD